MVDALAPRKVDGWAKVEELGMYQLIAKFEMSRKLGIFVMMMMVVAFTMVVVIFAKKGNARHYADIEEVQKIVFCPHTHRIVPAMHGYCLYTCTQCPRASAAQCAKIVKVRTKAPLFVRQRVYPTRTDSDFVATVSMQHILLCTHYA